MNLGGTESSPITELRWCCLGVGSFSSSLKWALLILLRTFWKDPFWHSMEDTKGSRPVSFSVKNLNSFLYLCWKERPRSQGSISSCLPRKLLLQLSRWKPADTSLGITDKQKTWSSGASNTFSLQSFTAGYSNFSISKITNFKTWIWRKHSSRYSEAGYVQAIPFDNQLHASRWKNRKKLSLDKHFPSFSPKVQRGFKNEDTKVILHDLHFVV